MHDIRVEELARYLYMLEPLPPVTVRLDKWGSRYPSQKVHMITWLRFQTIAASGAYGRSKPNYSAKVCYNRFLNPGGLLWLAEVLGAKEEVLCLAVQKAIEAEKQDYRGRCVAFRDIIPWAHIMEMFEDCSQWLYDQKMKALIELDTKGLPMIKSGKKRRYLQILHEEEGKEAQQIVLVDKSIVSEIKPVKKEKLTKAEKKLRGWEF